MKLQIIPVINKNFMTGFCPFPLPKKIWSPTAYDTESLITFKKMWNKQHSFRQYKVTKYLVRCIYCTELARAWNVINMCNFYVTDSKIYCNTRYFENTRLIHEQN